MPFADPTICLSCRDQIDRGTGRCPHCGMDLDSHEIQQAWRSLQDADRWVARAEAARSPTPDEAVPAPAPASAAPPIPAAPRRRFSAGTVLLVLGAISILVAGLIFVTVSWGSMGILGRALTLLAFTAVVGVLAALMARRRLRASAEALWTVFLGLLTLDWFAAVSENLFGLDDLVDGAVAGIWGSVTAVAGTAIVRHGRRQLNLELAAPSLAAGAAAGTGLGWVIAEWTEDFWWGATATVATGLAMFALHRFAVRRGSIVAGVFTGAYALFAVIAAGIETLANPSLRELTFDGHGIPLLIVAVAAVAVGRVWTRARSSGAMLATVAASTLVITPSEEAWDGHGGYLVSALIVGSVGFVVAGPGPWRRGVRWALVVGFAGLVLAVTPWLYRYVEVVGSGAFGPRARSLRFGLDASIGTATDWWLPLLVGAGLATALRSACRWPELERFAKHVRAAAGTTVGVAVLTAITSFEWITETLGGGQAGHSWPAVVVASGTLLVGVALAVLARKAPVGWRHVGPAVVVATPMATASSWSASILVWPATAAALFALALLWRDGWIRRAAVFGGTGWAVLTVGVLMRLLGYGNEGTGLALVVAGVVALGIAMVVSRREWTHRSAEVAAGIGLAYGLLLSAVHVHGAAWWPWTVGGSGVALLGLLAKRRRIYVPIGSLLLCSSYVLRLADAGVDVVEAYTAPFAALLIASGMWALRKSPSLGTVKALTAGSILTFLPSLPGALDEPTSLRALLLGLVAALFLAVGTRLCWKVPFAFGATVLLLLVLASIGPWALAVPRWMLIAALGGTAIAIGATWESRVRDGRAAVGYISRMR